MAKKKQQQELKLEGTATVSFAGKSILISSNDDKSSGAPAVLTVTNEYGNSARYPIEAHSFEDLWSQLWQFVKDSQH
ncbi:MAG TPA: hypothetical protein VHA09_07550 [Nitrososphaera sp.]|nr:hypothetical protein [Nitrososphaera sp.]